MRKVDWLALLCGFICLAFVIYLSRQAKAVHFRSPIVEYKAVRIVMPFEDDEEDSTEEQEQKKLEGRIRDLSQKGWVHSWSLNENWHIFKREKPK
jgi:hypothetical protein